VTGVLVQAVLLIFVMAALLILAQAANIHSATTLQGESVLNIQYPRLPQIHVKIL
jgi:hypothetical protein